MKAASGVASCTRVSMPSTPPIAKKTKAVIMMRRPMTEWLTAARRCSPGPVAQIAASCRCSRSAGLPCWPVCGALIRSASVQRLACASAAGKSSAGCTIDVEAHPGVPEATELVAEPFVAAWRVGLDAQEFTCPGTASILPASRGIQKAWMTSRLVTHDVDRNARGQVQHACGLHAAMVGIAEGPDPLLSLGLDPRRCGAGQRQEPLAGDQPVGDERRQDDGRQAEAAEHDPARAATRRAPAGPPDHQREEAP